MSEYAQRKCDPHWLLCVGSSELSTVHLSHDLICHDHRYSELRQISSRSLSPRQELTSSANLISVRRNFARCVCLADSSPLPEKSVLYRDVHESTMSSENLGFVSWVQQQMCLQLTWTPPSLH